MMPPVSLPLTAGIQSALAGATANEAPIASKLAANIFCIADSISARFILGPPGRGEKNGRGRRAELVSKCCRAALDRLGARRHGRSRRHQSALFGIAHARPRYLLETPWPCLLLPECPVPWRSGSCRLPVGAEFRAVRPEL